MDENFMHRNPDPNPTNLPPALYRGTEMSKETRTINASCICGNNTYSVTLPVEDFPLMGSLCHCDSCRHMLGGLCYPAAWMPPIFRPVQMLVDGLTPFVFSHRTTQYFCPNCGCHMLARTLRGDQDEVTWAIVTGTLKHIDGLVDFQRHIYIHDTLDGGFADMLTQVNGKRLARWSGNAGFDEIPLYRNARAVPATTSSANSKIRGHCKCGGVEFWVAKPSARSALAEKVWPELPSPKDVTQTPAPPDSELWWLRDSGSKFRASLCACNSCRLASGMETTFWAYIPTVDLSLDAQGKLPFTLDFGSLKKYSSSPDKHRYFCERCGATCFYDSDDRPYVRDVAIGLLDDPDGSRAESWLGWVTDKLDFREDTDGRSEHLSDAIEEGLRQWGQRVERK